MQDIGKTSLTGPATVILAGISRRPRVGRLLRAAHRRRASTARSCSAAARSSLVAVRRRAGRHRPAHHGRRHRRDGHLRPDLATTRRASPRCPATSTRRAPRCSPTSTRSATPPRRSPRASRSRPRCSPRPRCSARSPTPSRRGRDDRRGQDDVRDLQYAACSTSPTRTNLVGLIIGAAVVFLFSGLAINAVSRAAGAVVFEVRRPVPRRSRGSWTAPSARTTARSSTSAPGTRCASWPPRVCWRCWRRSRSASASASGALGAYLAGAIAAGTLMAVFLANSGGAWDNAKKMVEDGDVRRQGLRRRTRPRSSATPSATRSRTPPARRINPLIKVMNLVVAADRARRRVRCRSATTPATRARRHRASWRPRSSSARSSSPSAAASPVAEEKDEAGVRPGLSTRPAGPSRADAERRTGCATRCLVAGYTVDGVAERLGPAATAALGRHETVPARRATDRPGTRWTPWSGCSCSQLPVDQRGGHPGAAAGRRGRPRGALRRRRRGARPPRRPAATARTATTAQRGGSSPTWAPALDGTHRPLAAEHVLGRRRRLDHAGPAHARGPRSGAHSTSAPAAACRPCTRAGTATTSSAPTSRSRAAAARRRSTAALSGVRLELRAGDLLDPVARRDVRPRGEQPAVRGRGAGGASRHTYRDGGRRSTAVRRTARRSVPTGWLRGGTLVTLANWVHRAGADWADRVASWLPAHGVDALVVQRDVLDPAAYVATWLADAGERGTPRTC